MKRVYLIALLLLNVKVTVAATPPQLTGLTGCTLSSNPASLTTDCKDIQPPNISIPAVGVNQTSAFGAKYKRITIPSGGVGDTAATQMFPIYAKIPAWNSDGTKLMLMAQNGFLHLFDGTTYTHIRKISTGMGYSGTDPEPRWSKTDPNVFYYVYGMEFRQYNVAEQTSKTIHKFTDAECGGTNLTMIHNGDEGNSDDSDRYWTWYVQDGTYAQKRIIVYDKQTDSVISSKGYGAGGLCGTSACPTTANWVGMSHSGNHVVVNWNTDASDGVLTERGKGSEVFNRSLVYQNTSSEKNWHCDLAQLSDGTDVFVGAARLNETNGYRAIRAISLNDGSVKKSCMMPDYQSGWHLSGRSTSSGTKNWVLYSVYNQNGGSLGTGKFAAENFALNMDTCEVRRIAHAQSYWSSSNYYSEPHSTVNGDFTKIVWGSNWRDQNGAIQAYVAELGNAIPSPALIKIEQK